MAPTLGPRPPPVAAGGRARRSHAQPIAADPVLFSGLVVVVAAGVAWALRRVVGPLGWLTVLAIYIVLPGPLVARVALDRYTPLRLPPSSSSWASPC